MNLFDVVMNAGDGAAVRQIGTQLGLDETQTASALSWLVPALASGFQRVMQNPDSLLGLLSMLSAGQHQRYLDEPSTLAADDAVTEGNGVLGQILGSKDASRELADRAAAQTGLDAGTIKRMLPLAASLMMGAFSRQRAAGGAQSLVAFAGDANPFGSDVTGMVGRIFGRGN